MNPLTLSGGWIWPALGYVFVTGAIGITAKLFIRQGGTWAELVLWTAIIYALTAGILAARGARLHVDIATFAVASGILAVSGLVLYFTAVETGQVGKAVAFMSSFPIVTLVLSVIILAERVSVAQVLGVALVLVGLVLVSR